MAMFKIAGVLVLVGVVVAAAAMTSAGLPAVTLALVACFCGGLARMAQASGQHEEILKLARGRHAPVMD